MHPFYNLSRKLVHTFAPQQISLFYANDHLAVSFVPGRDLTLNGTTFRKVFRLSGLDSDWFSQQPCQKLTLLWAGDQGQYQAVLNEPAALDRSVRVERVTSTSAPQPLVSLLFEGLKTDAPDHVDMWPYLLGIPVYWNGSEYEVGLHKLKGWEFTIRKSKVKVTLSKIVEHVTMVHDGEQITAEGAGIPLPILIYVEGKQRPEISTVLARLRKKLRKHIDECLADESTLEGKGVHLETLREAVSDPYLKMLLANYKQEPVSAAFATLTGLGVRWRIGWSTDSQEDVHYWTEPTHVIRDPICMAAPSSVLAAILPSELPIVPSQGMPWGSKPLLPEIELPENELTHEGLGYCATSIRLGEHTLPFLVSFGESQAIINGAEETLLPGIYLVRGEVDFRTFWFALTANEDLLRMLIVCIEMLGGDLVTVGLGDACLRSEWPEIDAALVASFLLKEDMHLDDWRDRKAAGLLHKVFRSYPLKQIHDLRTLADQLSSKKAQGLVNKAIEAFQEERQEALEGVLAEFAPPEPEPVRVEATEPVSA
ncbi:MAG: hypothetical protein DWQ07_17540 [Chloroflexi bacterium]|nr:MAG: hypothetical protein DWQ07_17540 [Chloroflexota bacterium]